LLLQICFQTWQWKVFSPYSNALTVGPFGRHGMDYYEQHQPPVQHHSLVGHPDE
jgi:hypothetical protein